MAVQMLGEKSKKARGNGDDSRDRTVDVLNRNTFEMYDESAGYDDETGIKFAPGLSALDRKRATALYRLFTPPREITGLWSLCVIYGEPGAGKDTCGNYLAHTLKRYFPWKRILRDEPPRELFGPYGGLFNEESLQDDFTKMREIGKGVKAAERGAVLEKAADDWVSSTGEVLLKNSVLYLADTLWKRCNKREPHNPMNKTMGAIFKVHRHLDCFTLATIQTTDDLDRFTVKPYIKWMVTCLKSPNNPTGFVFLVNRVHYDKRLDTIIKLGQPFQLPVDAGEPVDFLGDGKIRITKRGWNYQPENDDEYNVLYVLKSGVDTYGVLIETLEGSECMTRREILYTLKVLGLRIANHRPKMVVSYPCYYKIFNSKSAPSLTTSVKTSD